MPLFRKPVVDFMIVGLGNPGAKYQKTRHNVGFRTTTEMLDKVSASTARSRFKGLVAMGQWEGKKLLMLQPHTYMNLSGESVKQAADYYNIPPERIIVIFDDISLPPGRIRVRKDGSAGGHNGIKSIIACLGSQNFPRVKVGVGEKPHPDYDLADWVLSSFSPAEEKLLAPAIEHAGEAALMIVTDGAAAAANHYNAKPQ